MLRTKIQYCTWVDKCLKILHASLRAPPNSYLSVGTAHPGLWGLHPGYLGSWYIGIIHTSSTYPMCLFYHVRIIGSGLTASCSLFRHQFGWMVKEHPNELNRMNLENFLLDNVTTVLMARMVGKNQIFAENCNETAMIEIPCKWVAQWSTIKSSKSLWR